MSKQYYPSTKFNPGGKLGAVEPPTLPAIIFARYVDASGATVLGLVDVVDLADPLPGAVAWGSILEWTPAV